MNWKEIYTHLKQEGFDVYSPGQHHGKCTSPYIVLISNGTEQNRSVQIHSYDCLLYYPQNRYSEFEDYIESFRTTMADLFPRLILADDEQPHFLDNDVQGYMTSLLYKTGKVKPRNSYIKGE